MGHANAQMLFNVYGKWIDGADKSRERDKLSLALSPEFRHDSATQEVVEVQKLSGINLLGGGERGIRTHTAQGHQGQA